MPCDAQTLENLNATDKLASLSDRDLLMITASLYGTAAGFATAQSALNNAYVQGMSRLSDADLEKAWLAAVC
jgi:hypothetical protein